MTFLHKLAQRLARMKTALIMGAVAAIACEIPLATDPSSVALLQISPKTSTLRTGQIAQFVVIGLTSTGDTAKFNVRWSATGGTIIDTSTTGGKHYGHYKSPNQPGQYKVIGQSSVAALSDSAVVTVSPVPVAAVSVSPAAATTIVGQTVQLTAAPLDSTGAALSGRVVTWASSNAGIATVSATGLVRGVATGSATIAATSEGKSGTAAITVTPVPVASVSVSPGAATVGAGQTLQLTATPRDASGNPLTGRIVTWASSNTAVATVSGSGLVTGVVAGSVTITATSEGQSGTATVTVAVPVASVTVSPPTASVVAGQTVQLTATPQDASGNPLTGRVITWASSNTAVARVNGSGLVTGVAAGSATITATSEGKSGTAAITVTPVPVASVTVSPATASVAVGRTVQLTATPREASGNPLTGRVITWASSNTALATVSGSGLVTGVAIGAATITATSEGQSGTAAITVTAAPPPGTTWPNEPAGWTVLNDYDAHAYNDGGWHSDPGYPISVVDDATAPLSPTKVWQYKFAQGDQSACGNGVANVYFDPSSALQHVYFGAWVKLSNPFSFPQDPEIHYVTFFPSSGGDVVLDIYADRVMIVDFTAGARNIDGPPGSFSLGTWHHIEVLLDGTVVKMWVDNVLVINDHLGAVLTTVEVKIAGTWGGCTPPLGPAFDSYAWTDHVHVSRP